MLADAEPALVLTRGDGTADCRPDAGAAGRPGDGVELAGLPTGRPTPTGRAAATHPAYVIYTSGSTGRPKGVVVPHARAAPASRPPRSTHFGVGPATGCCSSPRRASTRRCWSCACPLPAGAALVVPPAGPLLGRAPGRRASREQQVTPRADPAGRAGRPCRDAGRCRTSGRVIVGGEALPAELVAPVGARPPAWSTSYGPTEATVVATWYAMPLSPARTRRRSAGRSGNTRAYVLDARPAAGAGRRARRAVRRPAPGWPAAT